MQNFSGQTMTVTFWRRVFYIIIVRPSVITVSLLSGYRSSEHLIKIPSRFKSGGEMTEMMKIRHKREKEGKTTICPP